MIRRLMQAAMLTGLSVLFSLPAFGQAALVPNAQQQFVGPTGAPYANGSVFMYVPNTFTKKNTWRDPTQAQINANPILLDSSGRAIIYGLGSYRQVLKDKNNNQVWDNLTAAPTSSTNTPATSGAGDFLALGMVIPIAGFSAPTNYVLAYGQAISRTTYADALTAITISSTASCTSTSVTISGISSTAQMRVGAPIEASCLSPGTTIATIAGSTSVTVSAAAISTATVTVRVFPWGNGDGSTTFNVPDLRGTVIVGSDAMGGTPANRITSAILGRSAAPPGVFGGQQSATLVQGNLPAVTLSGTVAIGAGQGSHTHPDLSGGLQAGDQATGGGQTGWLSTGGPTPIAAATLPAMTGTSSTPLGGSGSAFGTLPPLLTVNYAIKVLNGTMPTVGVLSIGGITGDILCGTGLSCLVQTLALNFTPGTMASQNANNVAVSGGTIDGTAIGNTGPAAGNFSALSILGVPVGTSTSSFWSVGGGGGGSPIQYSGGRVNIGGAFGAAFPSFTTAGIVSNNSAGVVATNPGYTKSTLFAADFGVSGLAGTAASVNNSALQSAIDACANIPAGTPVSSNKGCIFQTPCGQINVSTTFNVTFGMIVQGCGGGTISVPPPGGPDVGGTVIAQACTSCDTFEVVTLDAVQFRDIGFDASLTATAGSFINIKPEASPSSNPNFGSVVTRIRTRGGYSIITCQLCGNYNFNSSYSHEFNGNGIVLTAVNGNADSGEGLISGYSLGCGSNAPAGILLQIQSAVKIVGNKIIGCGVNLFVKVDQGTFSGTLLVSSNSFEEVRTNDIRFEQVSINKNYGNVIIVGNEFSTLNTTSFQGNIAFINGAATYINRMIISSNVFVNAIVSGLPPLTSAKCILIGGTIFGKITDNICNNNGVTGWGGIAVVTNSTSIQVLDNLVVGSGAGAPDYEFSVGTLWRDTTARSFASLPANAIDGSQAYVTGVNLNTAPCTAGPSGAMIFRQNSSWRCPP